MPLTVCPACATVVEKDDVEDAETVAAGHNESIHHGDDMAQVFTGEFVAPDGVNDLYDAIRDRSMEQRGRFTTMVLNDDRLATEPRRDEGAEV